jgi:hypothetical protein
MSFTERCSSNFKKQKFIMLACQSHNTHLVCNKICIRNALELFEPKELKEPEVLGGSLFFQRKN